MGQKARAALSEKRTCGARATPVARCAPATASGCPGTTLTRAPSPRATPRPSKQARALRPGGPARVPGGGRAALPMGRCASRIRGPRAPTEVRQHRGTVLREATVSSSICATVQGPRLLPLGLDAHRNPPVRPLSPLHPLGSGWGWSRGASWRAPRQRRAIASCGATVSPHHPNGCTLRPQSRRRAPLEELEGAN